MFSGFKDINEVKEDVLERLVAESVSENIFFEIKRDLNLSNRDEKSEFVKDVSSFANSDGGTIIWGVNEEKGMAQELLGFDYDGSIDNLKLTIENILRDQIEPRLYGYEIKGLQLKNGKNVIIMTIPKSWNPPHRNLYNNKFHIKNSSGVHDASVDELRGLFMSDDYMEVAEHVRQERFYKITQRSSNLSKHERRELIVLHILPFSSLKKKVLLSHEELQKLSGYAHLFNRRYEGERALLSYNFDGALISNKSLYDTDRGETIESYVQLSRYGYIEAASVRVKPDDEYFEFLIYNTLIHNLYDYLDMLRIINISTPEAVTFSFDSVKRKLLFDSPNQAGPQSSLNKLIDFRELFLPIILFESYPVTAEETLSVFKPALDVLWNAAGQPEFPLKEKINITAK